MRAGEWKAATLKTRYSWYSCIGEKYSARTQLCICELDSFAYRSDTEMWLKYTLLFEGIDSDGDPRAPADLWETGSPYPRDPEAELPPTDGPLFGFRIESAYTYPALPKERELRRIFVMVFQTRCQCHPSPLSPLGLFRETCAGKPDSGRA